jgi:hypothetical protein
MVDAAKPASAPPQPKQDVEANVDNPADAHNTALADLDAITQATGGFTAAGLWAKALSAALRVPGLFERKPILCHTLRDDLLVITQAMHSLSGSDDFVLEWGLMYVVQRGSMLIEWDHAYYVDLAIARALFVSELGLLDPEVARRTCKGFLCAPDGMNRRVFLNACRRWGSGWCTADLVAALRRFGLE